MEQVISKEELEELMKMKEEIRGSAIKNAATFTFDKRGKEGLRRLEEEIAKLDYQIKLEEVKEIQLYPLGLAIASLVIMKRLFNFSDKDFQEMGGRSVKVSIVVRSLMQFLTPFSFEQIIRRLPEIWKRINPIGELKTVKLDQDERYLILRLEDYRTHPIQCQILIGAFSSLIQIVSGKKTTCEEIKCIYRGDEYHEFLIKW